jgi:hypothetical protein
MLGLGFEIADASMVTLLAMFAGMVEAPEKAEAVMSLDLVNCGML